MKRPAEAGRNFIKACSDLGPLLAALTALTGFVALLILLALIIWFIAFPFG
jgi:hypothetical protein